MTKRGRREKDTAHFALDLWVETLENGIESNVVN
jgi:hypothetical protein